MDFSANKQDTYEKRIASLPDQPNMQPDELKAYFDSSPEEIRQAHNGLCDALTEATSGTSAAAGLGFQRTAGVPADNVQAAVENVQQQLDAAVMGNIPSGSVTQDKLAQDVRDRFTAIENSATAEASTRASKDSNLQSQINTHTSQISSLTSTKCEVVFGSYTGDGQETRTIALGFYPQAVVLFASSGGTANYGGLAMRDLPCTTGGFSLASNGFTVKYKDMPTGYADLYYNVSNYVYYYIAFK